LPTVCHPKFLESNQGTEGSDDEYCRTVYLNYFRDRGPHESEYIVLPNCFDSMKAWGATKVEFGKQHINKDFAKVLPPHLWGGWKINLPSHSSRFPYSANYLKNHLVNSRGSKSIHIYIYTYIYIVYSHIGFGLNTTIALHSFENI
jgi:hypothetical protein